MAKLAIFLVASLCVGLCAAESLESLDEVLKSVNSENLPSFDETNLGYDLHNDFFYFADDIVSKEYARSKYADTKVSLAGQHVDSTGRTVQASVYPFVVGMKSMTKMGASNDRWDVKSWDVKKYNTGIQFFGLYHGNSNEFLVNKLRAHLLTNIANGLKDVLPVLDRISADKPRLFELVRAETRRVILDTFVQMDQSIRSVMKDNDDTSATASVVIVTRKFLITANVGQGKIVAHDSLGNAQELSQPSGVEDASNPDALNLFGLRKSKAGECMPTVGIYEREFEVKLEADEDEEEEEDSIPAKYQFVIVESPSVAGLLPAEEAVKIVRSQVNQHKNDIKYEQELYTGAATRILKDATKSIGFFGGFKQVDHSVMVIGLDTDYANIH